MVHGVACLRLRPVAQVRQRAERHPVGDGKSAWSEIPREQFVPKALLEFAFDDVSLPITGGLLLPRPSHVGVMLDALGLKAQDKVLEVGTGVGSCRST